MPFGAADRRLAPAPDPARVKWLREWTYAHRGLHGGALHGPSFAENSPAAFSAAIAAGFGIECDIQRSSDGAAMVFHDWELNRLTGERGPLAERDAEALSAVALEGGAGDCIPTLGKVLALVRGRVPIIIEIKSRRGYDVARSCEAVARELAPYDGQHAVMSFDPRVGRWFARHSPQTLRGLVMTEEDDRGARGVLRRHLWLWGAKPDFLAYDVRDLPSRFAAAQRSRGIPLLTWTVRSAELRARSTEFADAPIAEGDGIA